MPIPTPKADETEDEFISRCMTAIGDEYEDKDQALAICFDKWREILREAIGPAIWKFTCEPDAKTCDLCRSFEGNKYETYKIWVEFPYAMPLFNNVIEPNVHPNCRCQLILIEGIEMKEAWEETDDFIRSGHKDPDQFSTCKTTDFDGQLPKGIQAIYCKYKDKDEWATQSYIFPKDQGWTMDSAKAWFADHKEMRTEKLHKDFMKIQDEFTNYYCNSTTPCEQGTFEFNAWVSDLGLNTSKPYGKSLEAFQWAQDMIAKLKEDEDAVYYKVLFAFPTESMNGNVYTEKEIKNSVNSIIGKSPSLNHWEDTRKLFEEGGVKYIGAEYEDGACEALLKVPKDFVCPMCGEGKTLTSLIDDKKIVNVSLECTCELIGPGNTCIGLEFDAPTLLTSTNLPGFPMARIFPLEKIFSEALVQRRGGKRLEVKIVGLKEQELPDAQHQCPEGQIWNDEMGQCVEDKTCPEGQHWDDSVGACVADEKGPPEGTDVKLGVPAVSDTSKDALEAMTEDELVQGIKDIAAKIDKYYDDDIDTTEIEPLYALLTAYQDALKALIQQKALSPDDFKDALEVKCPEGMKWDPDTATCVQISTEQGPDPKSDAERAKAHFDISDEDWDALTDEEKQAYIDQLPPPGTGKEQIIECPDGQIWDPDTQKCITPVPAPTVTNQPVAAALELKVSDLELKTFKTEQKFKSAEEEIIFLKNHNKTLIVENIDIQGQLKAAHKVGEQRQATIDKRDRALIEKDKKIANKTLSLQRIIIEREKDIARKEITIEKMGDEHKETLDKAEERAEITSNARNVYKKQLEETRDAFEILDGKYNNQLDINLTLTKKLTQAQEDLLAASKRSNFLGSQLKKAKRLSKVVVTMDTTPSGE